MSTNRRRVGGSVPARYWSTTLTAPIWTRKVPTWAGIGSKVVVIGETPGLLIVGRVWRPGTSGPSGARCRSGNRALHADGSPGFARHRRAETIDPGARHRLATLRGIRRAPSHHLRPASGARLRGLRRGRGPACAADEPRAVDDRALRVARGVCPGCGVAHPRGFGGARGGPRRAVRSWRAGPGIRPRPGVPRRDPHPRHRPTRLGPGHRPRVGPGVRAAGGRAPGPRAAHRAR